MEILDPLSGPEWDRAVESHRDHSFFHSSAWARVLASSYGHQPFHARCPVGAGVVALIPIMEVNSRLTGRRGVCLPFTDFCVPLLFGESPSPVSCAPALVEALSQLSRERKWKHFELRGGNSLRSIAEPAVTFYGHSLDLRQGVEALFAGLAGSVRRAIRKAERSELRTEVTRSRDALLEFYRLHVQTRRRHGAPPQPLSFFVNIYEHIIKPGFGFVVSARNGSQTISSAVFFQSGKTAIYKFGASDRAMQELRGSNLVMWEAIRRLASHGCEILHLGRTSLSNEGLRRFKLSYGTREERIDYFKLDTASGEWVTDKDKASGFHTSVFSKLPSAVNRLAGAILYPHLD